MTMTTFSGRKPRVASALLAILALTLLTCGGCGKSDAEQAKTVAHDFIAAMDREDHQAANTLLTTAARQKIADGSGSSSAEPKNPFASEKDGSGRFTMGDAFVTENSATVSVLLIDDKGSHDAKLRLRREKDAWKVYALTINVLPGSSADLTIDFEHPEAMVGESFKVMGQGIGQAMKEAGRGAGEGMAALMKGMGEGAAAFEKGYREEKVRQERKESAPDAEISEKPPIIVERHKGEKASPE